MKFFEEPMLEMEELEVVDVITTSPTPCDDFGGGTADPFA